jgi:hypothetical protein
VPNQEIDTRENSADQQEVAATEVSSLNALTTAKPSLAEAIAQLYELLKQSGKLTAEMLRPLLALLPAGDSAHVLEAGNAMGVHLSAGVAFSEGLPFASKPSPDPSLDVDQQPAPPGFLANAGNTTVAASQVQDGSEIDLLAPKIQEETREDQYTTSSVAGRPVASPAQRIEKFPTLSMAEIIESATRTLSILKLKLSAVIAVTKNDDGWRVTAELVERAGVPDTSDVLGVYELQLDGRGNVLNYERTRLRRRCDLGR